MTSEIKCHYCKKDLATGQRAEIDNNKWACKDCWIKEFYPKKPENISLRNKVAKYIELIESENRDTEREGVSGLSGELLGIESIETSDTNIPSSDGETENWI